MNWDNNPYPYWYPFPMADALFTMVLALILLGGMVLAAMLFLSEWRPWWVGRETRTEYVTERVVYVDREIPAAPQARAIGNTRPATPTWAQRPALTEQPARVTATASDLMRERPAKVYQIPNGNRPERIAGPDRRQIGS